MSTSLLHFLACSTHWTRQLQVIRYLIASILSQVTNIHVLAMLHWLCQSICPHPQIPLWSCDLHQAYITNAPPTSDSNLPYMYSYSSCSSLTVPSVTLWNITATSLQPQISSKVIADTFSQLLTWLSLAENFGVQERCQEVAVNLPLVMITLVRREEGHCLTDPWLERVDTHRMETICFLGHLKNQDSIPKQFWQ